MPKTGETRYDTCWRKSRIAARILLREEAGRLTRRDVALGHKLAADDQVLPRLIQQAINGIRGKKIRLERERRAPVSQLAWREKLMELGEAQLRRVCAERGLNLDRLSEDEREELVNGLLHEK